MTVTEDKKPDVEEEVPVAKDNEAGGADDMEHDDDLPGEWCVRPRNLSLVFCVENTIIFIPFPYSLPLSLTCVFLPDFPPSLLSFLIII